MRKLKLAVPQNYKHYDLDFNNVDIYFEENNLSEMDIVVSGTIESIEQLDKDDKLVIMDCRDSISSFEEEDIHNIEKFIVYDILQYEELYAVYKVPRNKIYIVQQGNEKKSLQKLIQDIYKKVECNLYDIKVSMNSEDWVAANNEEIKIFNKGQALIIKSDFKDKEKNYNYIHYKQLGNFNEVKFANFPMESTKAYVVNFECEIKGNVDVQLFLVTYSDEMKLNTEIIEINNTKVIIPEEEAKNGKIALRVQGNGEINIKNLLIKDVLSDKNVYENIIDFSENEEEKYLILSNVYPTYSNLYRNGFVHRRVLLYKERNLNVDVFSMRKEGFNLSKYSFDGVEVYNGDTESLKILLREKKYKKILIHFVNEDMVKAIEKVDSTIPLVIWIHGYETERWHRRIFNYTEDEIEENKEKWEKEDNKKMKFMKRIYTDSKNKFIFVSNWFMKEVGEVDADCKVVNYEVIPNVIDNKLFNYIPKSKEQRKKILTIRPFASKKYANDLTVKAILELSKKDFFNELEFDIYGKGPMFHDLLEPIKKFDNVNINEKFLTQNEMSSIHKKNGIFICPTRLDAQGVSMCEAMSSGLIPITNGVTAIPEYVNKDSGILAKEEDYLDLAEGIEYLYNNPDVFMEMSRNTSQKIQKQCGINVVTEKEINAIRE